MLLTGSPRRIAMAARKYAAAMEMSAHAMRPRVRLID
jgi:hypothetical protein